MVSFSRAKARVAAGSAQEGLQDYQYALLIDPLNQAAKDGLLSLTTPDTGAQMSELASQRQLTAAHRPRDLKSH